MNNCYGMDKSGITISISALDKSLSFMFVLLLHTEVENGHGIHPLQDFGSLHVGQ